MVLCEMSLIHLSCGAIGLHPCTSFSLFFVFVCLFFCLFVCLLLFRCCCGNLRGTVPAPLVPVSLPQATPQTHSVSWPCRQRSTGDVRRWRAARSEGDIALLPSHFGGVLIQHTRTPPSVPPADDNVSSDAELN